jgi:hypothetical protein
MDSYPELHLIGMPRSGTSISGVYIGTQLRRCGLKFMQLMELFGDDSYLTAADMSKIESPRSLESRLDLHHSSADCPRLYKHIQDAYFTQVFDQIIDTKNQKWISISRDPLDQVASLVLAIHTDVFDARDRQQLSHFKDSVSPFVADLEKLKHFRDYADMIRQYRNTLQRLRDEGMLLGNIDYENCKPDIDKLSDPICDHFNIPTVARNNWEKLSLIPDMEAWAAVDDIRMKKLWNRQEKIDRILNWTDILNLLEYENII